MTLEWTIVICDLCVIPENIRWFTDIVKLIKWTYTAFLF